MGAVTWSSWKANSVQICYLLLLSPSIKGYVKEGASLSHRDCGCDTLLPRIASFIPSFPAFSHPIHLQGQAKGILLLALFITTIGCDALPLQHLQCDISDWKSLAGALHSRASPCAMLHERMLWEALQYMGQLGPGKPPIITCTLSIPDHRFVVACRRFTSGSLASRGSSCHHLAYH